MTVFNLKHMPDELHVALKIRAAERRISMHDLCIEYLREGLKQDKGKKPSKKEK